jgi:tripartite-type tricarboxylate transporter receptor subunit TctC
LKSSGGENRDRDEDNYKLTPKHKAEAKIEAKGRKQMNRTIRNIVAGVGSAALAAGLATSASAAGYPNKPIKFVVGFSAGGFADSVARIAGEQVSKKLGQPVVVDNKPGAASNIAAQVVASAKPDGYTVLVSTTSAAINASLYKKINYSLTKDLVPVAVAVRAPETFSAKPGGAKTLKDFINAAKNKRLTFGSAGVGSGSHLTWFYFFHNIAKVNAVHVPYKGGAPAMQAAMGGQVDGFAATASGHTVSQLVKGGKLTCLAVAAPKRYRRLPDCPTLAEAGYPNVYGSSWVAFWVPKGTPTNVIAALNGAINSIAENKQAAAKLKQNGDLMHFKPAAAVKFVNDEVATWAKRVKASGASVQ